LDEPATADETTASLFRFERKVASGKTIKLPIRTEMLSDEKIELLPLDVAKLEPFVKLQNVPPNVHEALAKVMDAKQALSSTQRQSEEKAKQISEIATEQSRIRENMKAVAASTDYYNRLVKKLDEQETQIEGWQKELDGLRKQIETQRKDLEAMVGQLTIGA
jgi:chromosome segregation ATPase